MIDLTQDEDVGATASLAKPKVCESNENMAEVRRSISSLDRRDPRRRSGRRVHVDIDKDKPAVLAISPRARRYRKLWIQCVVCTEWMPKLEYSKLITASSDHPRRICKHCAILCLKHKIEEGQWKTMTCPECHSIPLDADVRHILSNRSKAFLRYICSFSITLMSSFVELTFSGYN